MNPLIYVGAILGTFALIFIVSFICIKDKKEAFGFDRNMKDSEIAKICKTLYEKLYISICCNGIFCCL